MKYSAKLKESGFTILPNMAMCEQLQAYNIYLQRVISGMDLCRGPHHYVYYDERDKKIRLKTLRTELSVLPPFLTLVGNGYVQHAGTEYLNIHNPCYHVFFVPDDIF